MTRLLRGIVALLALMVAAAAIVLLVGGCKSTPKQTAPQRHVEAAPTPVKTPTQTPQRDWAVANDRRTPLEDGYGYHLVQPGECLWCLAPVWYEDPFLWPLIYMANRDDILDPDIIEPGQLLKVPRHVGRDEEDHARFRAFIYGEPED